MRALPGKIMNVLREIIREDVIPKQRTDWFVIGECCSHSQSLRDSLLFILNPVGEGTIPLGTTPQELHEVTGKLGSGDEHDLRNPCIQEYLEWVEHHRLSSNREKALMRFSREGEQAGAFSAADEDSFHCFQPTGNQRNQGVQGIQRKEFFFGFFGFFGFLGILL